MRCELFRSTNTGNAYVYSKFYVLTWNDGMAGEITGTTWNLELLKAGITECWDDKTAGIGI